jgi:hypothetical protein
MASWMNKFYMDDVQWKLPQCNCSTLVKHPKQNKNESKITNESKVGGRSAVSKK